MEIRTGKKAGIWLAFSLALALHFIFLFVPIASQTPVHENLKPALELQLTTIQPPTVAPSAPLPEPEKPVPEPEVVTPEPPRVAHEAQIEPPLLTTEPVARNLPPDLDNMSQPERRQLTHTILARQFFTEESAADQLFGKQIRQDSTEIQKEFHYPLKQNMLTLLDQPLPDVPFAYTPDLVYFAYEPGVKGDLQRFLDVITPEFGWRTKYGTEVRCILILVIVGCGWK